LNVLYLVSAAEARENPALGRVCRGGGGSGHAIPATSKADRASGKKQKDKRDERHPEA